MMPRLDGLELVAALRADPRTAAVPVLLLSARAGQEASIEGLQAGADDYLVKPFAAAELLARVRANIELARLRNHHARWRTALVDSLQEAFFVCDEHGAVIEINAAFTDILGYGAGRACPTNRSTRGGPTPTPTPRLTSRSRRPSPSCSSETHGSLHHSGDPPRRAPAVGHRRRSTTPRIPTPAAASWSARSATSPPSTTPCNARPRWPRSTSSSAQADTVDDAVQAAAEELRGLWQARRVLAAHLAERARLRARWRPTGLVCAGEPAQLGRPAVAHRDR